MQTPADGRNRPKSLDDQAKPALPDWRLVGLTVVAVGAAAGTVVSIVDYVSPSSGIKGAEGAILVMASTAILALLAAALFRIPPQRRILRGLVFAAALLDIIGSGVAAYFLESNALVALLAIALVGWLIAVASRRPVHA